MCRRIVLTACMHCQRALQDAVKFTSEDTFEFFTSAFDAHLLSLSEQRSILLTWHADLSITADVLACV